MYIFLLPDVMLCLLLDNQIPKVPMEVVGDFVEVVAIKDEVVVNPMLWSLIADKMATLALVEFVLCKRY